MRRSSTHKGMIDEKKDFRIWFRHKKEWTKREGLYLISGVWVYDACGDKLGSYRVNKRPPSNDSRGRLGIFDDMNDDFFHKFNKERRLPRGMPKFRVTWRAML